MDTNTRSLVIIDGAMHALWKKEIHQRFADSSAFEVVELNAGASATSQLAAIYAAHPHPAKNYVYAQKIGSGQEVQFGSTTYSGVVDLLGAVSPFTNAAGGGLKLSVLTHIDNAYVPGGTAGDDHFQSLAAREVFDGLDGLDTVSFALPAAGYTVAQPDAQAATASGVDLLSPVYVSGSGRSATLFNVERLQFADGHVALDLDDGDAANTAARLLTAVVGRDSLQNKALVGEIVAYADHFDLGTLARLLVDAGVMAQLAGGNSNAALINHLYTHIAGEGPSPADLQWTLDFVESAGLTQAGILEAMVQLPHTGARADLVGLQARGLEYLAYELS